MQAAVAFVKDHPGATVAAVVGHLLEGLEDKQQPLKATVYKQAAGVVDRVIRDRLVRQDNAGRLFPWDERWKVFAEALERAVFAAPDEMRFLATQPLAAGAWRNAGDDNRARILEGMRYREPQP